MGIARPSGIVNREPVHAVETNDTLDERYRKLARSVGCIVSAGTAFGTGWVVSENRVITNAHVVNAIDASQTGSLRDVIIDFGYGTAQPDRHKLKILHWEKDEHPDVGLFEFLSPNNQMPAAIPWRGIIVVGQPILLIGYPLKMLYAAHEIQPDYLLAYRSLMDNLNRKVCSPGEILVFDPDEFWHTCNTFNGCSGSVILAEIDEQVVAVGLHECGEWTGAAQNCAGPDPHAANRAVTLRYGLMLP